MLDLHLYSVYRDRINCSRPFLEQKFWVVLEHNGRSWGNKVIDRGEEVNFGGRSPLGSWPRPRILDFTRSIPSEGKVHMTTRELG